MGEYWIEDINQTIYCDGDVVDTNHEREAYQSMLGISFEEIDFDFEFGYNPKYLEFFDTVENIADIADAIEANKGDINKAIKNGQISEANILKLRLVENKGYFDPEDFITIKKILDAGGNTEGIWHLIVLGEDPREYAMESDGWIRVVGLSFQTWVFDAEARDRIQSFENWENELRELRDDDVDNLEESNEEIYVEELSTGTNYSIKIKDLFNNNYSIDDLKAISRGEFNIARPKNIYVPEKFTTDSAGDDKWQYRRIGENPSYFGKRKLSKEPFRIGDRVCPNWYEPDRWGTIVRIGKAPYHNNQATIEMDSGHIRHVSLKTCFRDGETAGFKNVPVYDPAKRSNPPRKISKAQKLQSIREWHRAYQKIRRMRRS